MPTTLRMPALSPTMEVGKLAKWLVKEGDTVAAGDVIAEIETDKATMEVEAMEDGVVGRLLVAEGAEDVPVNTPIALILGEGESLPADMSHTAQEDGFTSRPAPVAQADTTEDEKTPEPEKPTSEAAQPASPSPSEKIGEEAGFKKPELATAATATSSEKNQKRIFASPLARHLARETGLDLSQITGTGPRGRIVKRDIEAALAAAGQTAPAGAATELVSPAPAEPQPRATVPAALSDREILALYEPGSYSLEPHDGMRRVIAERLTLAKSTIPHFYLTIDCRLDALLAARKELNARAGDGEGPQYRLSVNDFLIKAMALALQRVPDANATWTSEGILKHKRVDIAVAVAVEGGLFTPVIRHADMKTLSEISNEMRDLAERARRRRLAPEEYQGGTTTISNLGMFGIRNFDAVINPPHATILAVGKGEKRPVVTEEGELGVATLMTVTLSCDHRVVDGALGARLLEAFRGFVESPVTMLA